MTPHEAAEIVGMITVAWPNPEMSEPTAALYIRCLVDLNRDATQAATLDLVATNTFRPTVAELRGAAAHVTGAVDLPGIDQAWAEVMGQVRAVGWYGTPTFTRPEITQAIEGLGGWQRFCEADDPHGVTRAHFRHCYEAVCDRTRREAVRLAESRALQARVIQRVNPKELLPKLKTIDQ